MKNKKTLGIVISVILIFAILPYFVGNIAKENIAEQAEKISQIPGYALEIRNYDQGWFTSSAVVSYGFDAHTQNILEASIDEKDPFDKDIYELLKKGLVFDITVAHGPITFQNGVNFALLTLVGRFQDIDNADYKNILANNNLASLLDIFSSVSYRGNTTIKATAPAFKADDAKTAVNLIFSGMELQAIINAQQDKYDVIFNFAGSDIQSPKANLSLQGITAQATGTRMNDSLWLGKGSFSVGHFKSETAISGPAISFYNFSNEYDLSKESDTTLTMRLQSKVGRFVANEDIQDTELKEITLDFTLNHLNSEAITDYVKSVQESYQTLSDETPTAEQTAENIQIITTRTGEKILKGSPELVINKLGFLMNDGFYKSEGKLSFDGTDLENIAQLSDPQALNKKLAITSNVTFNMSLVKLIVKFRLKQRLATSGTDVASMPPEQIDQMVNVQAIAILQTFINQGYIMQNGEEYTLNFEMTDGNKLFNGKPLAIPGM